MWVICAWFTQIFKRPVSAIINTQTRTVYSQAIFLKPGQGLWDCGGFVVCQCSKAKTMCLGKSKQHLEGRNEMAAMLVVRRLVWDQALSRLTTMPCVCWLASLMQGKSSAYSSSNSFLIFPESSLGLWVTPWQSAPALLQVTFVRTGGTRDWCGTWVPVHPHGFHLVCTGCSLCCSLHISAPCPTAPSWSQPVLLTTDLSLDTETTGCTGSLTSSHNHVRSNPYYKFIWNGFASLIKL